MFVKPMLMLKREKPFDDDRFIFEPIIDGHRLQLSMVRNKVRLYTKYGYDVTRQYPELHNVPLKWGADIIIDGEVAYINPSTGKAEFDILLQRFKMKKDPSIREGKAAFPVNYFVFDILYYNGIDLRQWPLLDRKRLLHYLLEDNAYYKKMRFVETRGSALYELARQSELEGVACKRKDSLYREGRNESWLKINCS